MAALSRIAGGTTGETTKRQTPIFQREPAITEKQSIQDAANALATLWKIVKPLRCARLLSKLPSLRFRSEAQHSAEGSCEVLQQESKGYVD